MRIRKRSSCDSGSGKVPIWYDRVLRGDDEERLGQRPRLPSSGHLVFFHGLQQRALRLGRGTVDLVGQHQLAKIGPGWKWNCPSVAVEDRDAEDVGRQQVAGELDALEVQPERCGQGMRQRGLADAGHVLDQQVAARQQAGERQPDLRAPCRG